VNDEAVLAAESQSYRDLFSAIFGDFHLFQRLYGLAETDENEVNYWLEKLEIIDKVQFNEGKLTTVSSLSTGQRKRVALLVSILEKRPVIILDEWASDQDPEFRKFFYETIIPELKALKKLVIAITHDDNYFDQADHLLLVDQGKLYANV
jgi:putative ATP-binding cassette transporter